MRVWSLTLILIAAALAGCAGSDSEPPADDLGTNGEIPEPQATPDQPEPQEDLEENGGEDAQNATEEPAVPEVPVPSLAASAVEAEAPADINFTLDAEYDEGDELTWILDVTGDGEPEAEGTHEDLPATFTYSFTEAGNHTVVFTVEGKGGTVADEIVVRVSEAEEEAGFAPIEASGSVLLPCLHCIQAVTMCVGLLAGENEVSCFWLELPENATGHGASIESNIGFVSYRFLDECSSSASIMSGEDDATSPATSEVPEGAGCLVIYELQDLLVDYTVRIA